MAKCKLSGWAFIAVLLSCTGAASNENLFRELSAAATHRPFSDIVLCGSNEVALDYIRNWFKSQADVPYRVTSHEISIEDQIDASKTYIFAGDIAVGKARQRELSLCGSLAQAEVDWDTRRPVDPFLQSVVDPDGCSTGSTLKGSNVHIVTIFARLADPASCAKQAIERAIFPIVERAY